MSPAYLRPRIDGQHGEIGRDTTIVKRGLSGVSLRRLKRIISINSGGRDTENDRFRPIQRPLASQQGEVRKSSKIRRGCTVEKKGSGGDS